MPSSDLHGNLVKSKLLYPQIARILGGVFYQEASLQDDLERNTDMCVVGMDGDRIACRVRKHADYLKYAADFTLRYRLNSGHPTEWHKVLKGWGDYLFYGFATEDGKAVAEWRVINLREFRMWHERKSWEMRQDPEFQTWPIEKQTPGWTSKNSDDGVLFKIYTFKGKRAVPLSLLTAHSGDITTTGMRVTGFKGNEVGALFGGQP